MKPKTKSAGLDKRLGRPNRPSMVSGSSGKLKNRTLSAHDDEWQFIKSAAEKTGQNVFAYLMDLVRKDQG